jgi:hypothetical protein
MRVVKKHNPMKLKIALLILSAGMFAGCEPKPGSHEAIIAYTMQKFHCSQGRAEMIFDGNPEGITQVYNFYAPHGRYHN